MKKLADLLLGFSARLFPGDDPLPPLPDDNYFHLVEQAKREWRDAEQRFNQFSDPDLVDHAIYALEAAERRYIFLLKQARKEGFTLYPENLQ